MLLAQMHWRPSARRILRRIAPRREFTCRLGSSEGLGSHLHRIASTYGIARARGSEPRFNREWPYRSYFNLPEEFFVSRLVVARCRPAVDYAETISIEWRRWLQDTSLWWAYRQDVWRLLQPNEFTRERAHRTHPTVQEMTDRVAIHVRRGDFLNPNDQLHRPVPMEYYEEAVAELLVENRNATLVVFSDDIPWTKTQDVFAGAYFVEGTPSWADLALMAECEHHVCANSTFSWWGAFLSHDPRPTAPWLNGVLPEHLRSLHPPTWRVIGLDPA